jgi:hypothetical protein
MWNGEQRRRVLLRPPRFCACGNPTYDVRYGNLTYGVRHGNLIYLLSSSAMGARAVAHRAVTVSTDSVKGAPQKTFRT